MATAQLIDIDNFSTLLVASTDSVTGTPDGNIYFNTTNDTIELITAEDLAQVDLGGGLEANPLTDVLGITLQALYAFERQERGTTSALRKFLPGVDGTFKFSGAYVFINGIKPGTSGNAPDRSKLRGSGWIEKAADGGTDRIYFGPRSLNNIEAASQPYYQLVTSPVSDVNLQSAAPVDFDQVGPIDEGIQVLGSTANTPSDATAGDFDSTAKVLYLKVREFGYTQGEATSTASGIGELNGFRAGFGIGEVVSPTTNYTEADVFGGSAIAPFSTMTYEHFDTPQSQGELVGGPYDFSDIVANPANGTLSQLRAYLDALMRQDTDQDAGAGSFIPKRADVLYTINTDGKLVTRQGLFLENVPSSDRQSILQTDDTGTERSYPFTVEVRVAVSDAWVNDTNAWAQCMYVDGAGALDFDTATAVIVQDSLAADVTFTEVDATGSAGSYELVFSYDYDNNTQAGLSAATDKAVVFLAEGDGGAQAAITFFTITRNAIVTASALAEAETNI